MTTSKRCVIVNVQYVEQKGFDKVNKLKQYRKEKKLTQTELSKKSGVSRTIISSLENQKEIITTTGTLKKIANALERQVSEIFYS